LDMECLLRKCADPSAFDRIHKALYNRPCRGPNSGPARVGIWVEKRLTEQIHRRKGWGHASVRISMRRLSCEVWPATPYE